MVSADEIRSIILKLADQRGPEKSFYASEVARSVDPDNWKDLMGQVRFVADVLIREGKIRAMDASGSPESWAVNDPVRFVKV